MACTFLLAMKLRKQPHSSKSLKHVALTAAAYAQPYIKPEAMEGAAYSRDRRPGVGAHPVTSSTTDGVVEAVESSEDSVEAVEVAEVVIEG